MISVIIPAYNHDKFIQKTIESIINQTYKKIELLVIDDGSVDQTWEKILEITQLNKDRFESIYLKKQKNIGLIHTLNKMIKESQGEFVFFIASDDIAKNKALEKLSNILKENKNANLAVGDNEFIDTNGIITSCSSHSNTTYEKTKKNYTSFNQMLFERFDDSDVFGSYRTLILKGNHVPNGYLVRKSIFEKIGLFTEESPLEDYWLMLQISKYSNLITTPEVLFEYRIHNSNSSKDEFSMVEKTNKTLKYEQRIIKCKEHKKIRKFYYLRFPRKRDFIMKRIIKLLKILTFSS